MALRKMKMGDLMEKQQTRPASPIKANIFHSPMKEPLDSRPLPAPPSPSKLPSPARQPIIHSQKSRKRKSSAILIPSDKDDNEPDTSNTAVDSIAVQKNPKRAKTATASSAPKRTASRTQKKAPVAKDVPSGVLSPRSHNSRALPRSPIKDYSPAKEKDLPAAPNHVPAYVPAPAPAPAPASPMRQQPYLHSPSKPQSPFKMAASAGMSAISAFAKRGFAAANTASAKLTRPISREKDQPILSGLGTAIPVPTSPSGKMLPPPRPALATLTSTTATMIPNLSPQRTASQASIRSNMSEQSNVSSTNGTIITKPTRAGTLKKAIGVGVKTATAKKTTTTTAIKTKQKIVVSGSTTTTLSPKAMKKVTTNSATTTAAAKKAVSAAAARKAAPTPAPSGRVLRKRN